jgi:hypothetical protein
VGGLLIPHMMMQSFVGQKMLIVLESTKVNPEIPKDRFDVPAEVKALINK